MNCPRCQSSDVELRILECYTGGLPFWLGYIGKEYQHACNACGWKGEETPEDAMG